MTCAEFQKVLPYIIETGGKAEEERHLRECPVCSDLVQDLRYIVEQAKLLVPMEDPSPRVWEGIKESLEREGMIKPARARGRLLGPIPWMAALGAMILVSLGTFLVERARQQQLQGRRQQGGGGEHQEEVHRRWRDGGSEVKTLRGRERVR